MGQKTHPIGIKLGINQKWVSNWFDKKGLTAELIEEDYKIRRYIKERIKHGDIAKIEINRTKDDTVITLHTSRPAVVIGRRGVMIERLTDELKLFLKKNIEINVQEIKEPELNAQIVAETIARQIEQKVDFRRAMKRAIADAMKVGAKGIKIECKGRLRGQTIARKETYKEGKIPLQTLRSKIDYGVATAVTNVGCVGVKVWIYLGEGMYE